MNDLKRRPRKSLRTLLMLWFLIFSVVPLAFITGYSLVKYEQAINKELLQRLRANFREIEVVIGEFQSTMTGRVRRHSRDRQLAYLLSNNKFNEVRALATQWMRARGAPSRMALFGRDGRLEVYLYLDRRGEVQRRSELEGKQLYISEALMEQLAGVDQLLSIDVKSRHSVELAVTSKVRSGTGLTVGYLEEIVEVNRAFLDVLKNRLNIELIFFQKQRQSNPAIPISRSQSPIVASHVDLESYPLSFFSEKVSRDGSGVADITIREEPYGFVFRTIQWGGEEIHLGLGASKRAVRAVLRNVNYAFFTVVGAIVVFLIVLSVVIARILLRPLQSLIDVIQAMEPESELPNIENTSENEFGLVIEAFNQLSRRVNKAQGDLRNKVTELEEANNEIRDTQAKLVHTAKMASLGQLVAGVAHELNNPIGFIFSNMGHLREYSQKLIHLLDVAEKKPEKLKTEKEKAEYDYLVQDLPKLIRSCEDGARRTRDIVLGLRNFSRLEEAKLKDFDIHDGIEATLQLLQGELKGRVKVKKNFAELSPIRGYPSQLNQVFMNILSNAAQAIEGEGTISITTKKSGKDRIAIVIKDTGRGMSNSTMEKIFDPFFTTKGLGQGTGLGLSISYGIVQDHGGDIAVKSELGKGTEFTIFLPINSHQ